jgi:hypothetical protein
MSYLDAIAVMRVEGTVVEYTREDYDRVNLSTRWIFDNLTVEAELDADVEPTPIVVLTTPEGDLIDVLVNDVSIGYFACRIICLTLAKPRAYTTGPGIAVFPRSLEQAQLIVSGEASKIDLEALLREHGGIFVAPLFGETA